MQGRVQIDDEGVVILGIAAQDDDMLYLRFLGKSARQGNGFQEGGAPGRTEDPGVLHFTENDDFAAAD